MTILAQDIKLRASRVMADVPEGGGGPSAVEIGFGESNTMFDDIDSVSRTLGNVSIRQVHMHVDTVNTDRLLGAYAIVAKLPVDPNVDVTLATCAPFATRSEIAEAIANYLIAGVPWNGFLLGNHVQGQRNIQIFQRPGGRLPTIGRTLVLVVNEGQPSEQIEWVRVIRVDSEVQTFTFSTGSGPIDYQGLVVTCEIASPLSQALPGTDPNREFQVGVGKTRIRDTTTADAASYYGAAALAEAAEINDLTLKCASAYGQLVPSSATPVPSLDQRPAAQRLLTLAESPRLVEVSAAPHTSRIKISQENRTLSYIGQMRPVPAPGTVSITWVGLGDRYVIEDDGVGGLSGPGGVGTVNYTTGSWSITLPSLPDIGSAIVVTHGEKTAYTNRASQGASIRRPEYVFVLDGDGLVVPDSLVLEYPSGEVVKTCTTNGLGVISGDGVGRVDPISRTVWLRPSHMLDAGGSIHCEYDLETRVVDVITDPATPGGVASLSLTQEPVPGTVSVAWLSEGSTTAFGSPNAVKGWVAGEAVSRVAMRQDDWQDEMTQLAGTSGADEVLVPSGTFVSDAVTYDEFESTGTDGIQLFAGMAQGSGRATLRRVMRDDGQGGFADGVSTISYGGQSILLRTKVATLRTGYESDYQDAADFADGLAGGAVTADLKGGSYQSSFSYREDRLPGSNVIVTYRTGTPAPVGTTMNFTPPHVVIDLCPYTDDRIVPGSLRFTWMGQIYEDSDGEIFRLDGSDRIRSGRCDYAAGLAIMTDYVVGGSGPTDISLQSLWTSRQPWLTASLFAMTSASPVVPTQFTLFILDSSGNALTATGDLNGDLQGDHVLGRIEYESGLVELQFGDFVVDDSLTEDEKEEWWYSASDVGKVEAGKIWRPWPVDPSSLRYNIVSNLYLPVDPEILGLNPTRLPQDGRVPIFAKGRILIVGHNDRLAPDTYSTGEVDCGRTRLSHVWLIGDDGKLITDGWSASEEDLDAGKIQISDVSGWSQPVTIEHRIQDMVLCTDVQIDGTLGINLPLSHNFPQGSVVSSAVLFGSTWARVAQMFDQQSWNGTTWLDEVSGNPATATYNDTAFPVIVSNAGALSDRYALRIRSNATDFDFLTEGMGTLGSGTINADFEPINPIKPGTPLFKIESAGWGSGWVSGNVLFMKVQAAMQSMAVIRTVQPGSPAGIDYSFDLLTGGDIDRPPNDAP